MLEILEGPDNAVTGNLIILNVRLFDQNLMTYMVNACSGPEDEWKTESTSKSYGSTRSKSF
jgi:hypothetical protein